MLTERIRKLKEITEDYDKICQYIPLERTPYTPDAGKPPILRKAEAVAAMCEHLSTAHMPGSRLAGLGSFVFAPTPSYLTEEELEEIRSYPKSCSEELLTALEEKIFCLVPYLPGHIAVDQTYILKHGVNGMLQRLEERLKDDSLKEEQRNFLLAAQIEWRACLRYAQRYSDFYYAMARQEQDSQLREEYEAIAGRIAKVPANPAETFAEALQSMWFMYRCVHMEDVSGHTFGRLDQILYPYYQRDIERGVITEEDARDYFYDFWLKFCAGHAIFEREGDPSLSLAGDVGKKSFRNGLYWLNSLYAATEHHVDDGYPINIAGLDENGNDATNAISWMTLDAVRELRTFSVKPVVKYSEKTDPEFMAACYELIMDGRALPSIAYDRNTREGLLMEADQHYTEEDLLQASNIGCIEVAIPGKSYTDAMDCFMNLPKILLTALHNGYIGGRRIGMYLPTPRTFEEVKENFSRQLDYFIGLYTKGQNDAAPFYNRFYMRPLSSTLMEDCIEKAQLLDDGGARFWCKSMNCCGIADVADSLMAVKQVVFEERRLTIEELWDTLDDNFAHNEPLRQYLVSHIPKYGNGNTEVDELAQFTVDEYCRMVSERETWNGNRFRPGLYSFYGSIVNLGEATGALPSGRKAGAILALNIAPEHGAIQNGLTAVLESVTAFDHRKGINGCPVDLQITPDTPVTVLDAVNRYLNERNALLLQVNVTNREDLIEAQKYPERYQDLIVRVSGFSARFVVLDKSVQDEIIQRSNWG